MRKLLIGLVAALLLVGVVSVAAYAQGNLREYTGYQVMNLSSTQSANVRVDYYGPAGGTPVCTKNLDPIPPGGSANVQQKTENCGSAPLPDGVYSAVLSSDQPIAAVVGQVMSDPGTAGAIYKSPFSEYSGVSAGSRKVILPELMSNWFGIDSLVRVQNTGNTTANISVQYYAGTLNGQPTGNPSIAAKTYTIPSFAAITLDQGQINADLAAQSGTFQGKFLGSAVITGDQPLAAVVNQTDPTKRVKYTYNGFGESDDAGTELLAPAIFWQWYNTLTSLAVQNTSTSNPVNVTITYTAGPGSLTTSNGDATGQTKQVTFTLGPGESSTRYEGSAGSSDLASQFNRFGGSARITANGPVVGKVNQTQYTATSGQLPSGAYNATPTNKLTTRVAVPLIQAGFYSFFTSLTCANSSTTQPTTITVRYTSDALSAHPNVSGEVTHNIAAGGSYIVYEGQANGSLADIYKTGSPWWVDGARNIFNGPAFVTSSGPGIACTVNEVGTGTTDDNMYTYNGVGLATP